VTWNSASSTPTQGATNTPPVIQIDGANPAIIHVGDTYSDLGATITGPQQDLNLGIRILLNGTAATTGYGAVGPKTRARLNALYAS
jgi:hypothetical protein